MVICVVSATVGTIATSMWIKLVISSKISMAGTYISRFRVYGIMVALTCSLLKKGTKVSKGESTNFKRLYSNICFPRFSSVSKLEICAWTHENFRALFQKRRC